VRPFDPSRLIALIDHTPGYTLRNVFETIALMAGYKPVMRLVLEDSSAMRVREELRDSNLAVVVSSWKLRPKYTTSLKDVFTEIVQSGELGGNERVVAVSRTEALAEQFLEAEIKGDDVAICDMLGYPRCCSLSYQNISSKRDWLTELLSNTTHCSSYPHETNRIAYLFNDRWIGFDYFPCSLQCVETKRIFTMVNALLHECGLGAMAEKIKAEMKMPILIRSGVIVQLREARVTPDRLTYDLSRSGIFGWNVEEGADNDPIWSTDCVVRSALGLQFFSEQQFVMGLEEGRTSDRLLVFE
jgi:hypothetical protein